jgi:hypothetical protein
MNRPIARSIARSLIPLAIAAMAATAAVPSWAQRLIAPDATIASFSQSFLSAQHAQWAISFPARTSPVLDTTGAFSASGNQGSYFFLTGSGNADPVVRNVTVRPNQVLFFNLVAVLANISPGYETEAAIRADAADFIGFASNLSVSVDGAAALMPAGFNSLDQFRQSSPLFPMNFIVDNIFGVPPGVIPAIVDGYFVGLEALSKGSHELHFTAQTNGIGPYAGLSFSQDITYHINSVPEASTWAMMGLGLLGISAGAIRRRRG